jgi:nicotinate phosphoribosyltransferase
MVFKLVAHQDDAGEWVSVAKASAAKATVGGRKRPVRRIEGGRAVEEAIYVEEPIPADAGRTLLVDLVTGGDPDPQYLGTHGVGLARAQHAAAIAELPPDALRLGRGDAAIPTTYY